MRGILIDPKAQSVEEVVVADKAAIPDLIESLDLVFMVVEGPTEARHVLCVDLKGAPARKPLFQWHRTAQPFGGKALLFDYDEANKLATVSLKPAVAFEATTFRPDVVFYDYYRTSFTQEGDAQFFHIFIVPHFVPKRREVEAEKPVLVTTNWDRFVSWFKLF